MLNTYDKFTLFQYFVGVPPYYHPQGDNTVPYYMTYIAPI